jgi:hypothetical protein
MSDDPDFIALVVSRDERFRQLQLMINVEADMRDNPTIRALLAAVWADAEVAMRELADASPYDKKTMGQISARVGAHVLIQRYLKAIINRGTLAEGQIKDQDLQYGDPDE